MKLTLDKAWELTLAQWKWIVEARKKRPAMMVSTLKRLWATYHFLLKAPGGYFCFFCGYDRQKCDPTKDKRCDWCPGRLVDKRFHCENTSYHWEKKPNAFYRKLIQLNTKRLNAKRKDNDRKSQV